ncbi:DUF6509 family protein [Peribacillus frigoritolerans]|nr:DUF6509 family protein [Peribacillus frigoritolerans]
MIHLVFCPGERYELFLDIEVPEEDELFSEKWFIYPGAFCCGRTKREID